MFIAASQTILSTFNVTLINVALIAILEDSPVDTRLDLEDTHHAWPPVTLEKEPA